MKYQIPQSILDETECPYNMGCLTDGKCNNGPVPQAAFTGSRNITFLKSDVPFESVQGCPYMFKSFDKLICKCPVRFYLCKEYGV